MKELVLTVAEMKKDEEECTGRIYPLATSEHLSTSRTDYSDS